MKNNRTLSMMTASAVVLGSLMVGCSTDGQVRPKLTAGDAHSLMPRIERMLADKDVSGALAASEQLVATDPHDDNARAMLGRAYLANGRYLSARTAFSDAMTLGNRDPRTIVSLALAEAGLGNLEGARGLLGSHIADLPAGDYGLAMAMAGDPREGVRALVEATRAPDANAKTRQNLAYALAMAGAWGQARLIAGQDLSARDAEQRIGEWGRAFAQGTPSERVVAMIGATPRHDDAGLPVQLALNLTPRGDTQPAQAAAAETTVPAEAVKAVDVPASAAFAETSPPQGFNRDALAVAMANLPAASSSVQNVPQGAVAASMTQREAAVAPAVLEAAFNHAPVAAKPAVLPAPSAQALNAAFRQPAGPAQAQTNPTSWTSGLGAPATDAKASDWVVQLGAFNSDLIARAKWQDITTGQEALRYYRAVHSVFQHNGRTFHRLAIRGFEDRGAAAGACATLKSAGQDCFVRLDDSGATRQARAQALGTNQQASAERGSGRVRAAS